MRVVLKSHLIALSLVSVLAGRAGAQESSSPEPPAEAYGAKASVKRAPLLGETPSFDTASKLNIPFNEAPATVYSMNLTQVQEQRGAGDLTSALYYAPGVNPVWRYGGFLQMRSRGFRSVLMVDGRRDNRSTLVNSHPVTGLWDLDRIETLQGQAGVLYGYGAIGGVVNLIRKQPQAARAYELDIGLGTPGQRRAHVGATGAINDYIQHRVDIGHTRMLDHRGQLTERNQATAALRFLVADGHQLLVRVAGAVDHYNTDTGIPTIEVNGKRTLPPNTNLSNRYNSPQDGLDYERLELQLGYQWDVSKDLVIRDRLFYNLDDYEYFSTEYLAYDDSGERPVVRRSSEEDWGGSGYLYFFHHFRSISNQLEAIGQFSTGPVSHRALVGYEIDTLIRSYSDRSSTIYGEPVADLDFAYPNPIDSAVPILIDGKYVPSMFNHSVYLNEQAKLPFGLSFVGGARLDFFNFKTRRDTLDTATGATTERGETDSRDEAALTYQLALLYQPLPWLSGYVSWATSFEPNTSTRPYPDRRIEPARGRQLEAGVKLFQGDRHRAQLSAYRIVKSNVTVPGPMDSFETAGKVSSRGLELQVQGDYGPLGWTLGGAITDATYDNYRTSADEDLSGNRPTFVPTYDGSLWLTYSPFKEIGLGAGGRVLGRQYGDDGNRLPLDGYALMDASAWYSAGPVRFTFTANNLFDKRHYFVSSINSTQLTPGPGRVLLLQAHAQL